MGDPVFQAPVLVIDTETTGFATFPWSRVVELAAVLLDEQGELAGTFAALVRPEIHDNRSDGVCKIHGLTKEALKDAPLAGDVAETFRLWKNEKCDLTVRCTSYNREFDQPMVERMGLTDLNWGPCIMEMVTDHMGPLGLLKPADPKHPKYRPGKKWLWPSLDVAAKHFGVAFEGPAHRALTDAMVASQVLVACYRQRSTAPAVPADTMELE